MPRNVPWRRNLSDFACASQAFAANATIYILRQTGPTGFLLKEEGETKDVKVFLGDPHSCTCSIFRKQKDLCKHICWVLLKKFRVDRDNPLSWQLGLSDLELNEVMRGPVVRRQQQQRQRQTTTSKLVTDASGGRAMVAQREISDDDVCPICQDELLEKKLPVTYCKFGCGNNVHIKCMKVWAEHQLKTSQDQVIKCPMCREDFGPITLLQREMQNAAYGSASDVTPSAVPNPNRMDRHVGIGCSNCRMAPIEGKCYRCSVCADFYLCQACFNTPAHTHHSFQFRHKRNQRWRNAQRTLGAALPDAIINNMLNRDLSEDDYELLLQLDNPPSELSDLTEEVIQQLSVEKVRERGALLAPGAQCRVCLRGFEEGQYVRKLPCQHKFHKDCIDGWLLHTRPTCPIDGTAVFTNRPHSDTANRRANRHTNLSAGSGGDAASIISGHSGRDEVRSLSVPALGVTAVRLGGAGEGEGRREGERGLLARRPPRDPHIPHRPPLSLELTGTRVGADEGNTRPEVQDVIPPGSRLLHQAMQRRARLNDHLASLMLNNTSHPHADNHLTDFAGDHTSQQTNNRAIHAADHQISRHFPEPSPLEVAAGLIGLEDLTDTAEAVGGRRRSVGSGSTQSQPERVLNRRHPHHPRSNGTLRQRSNSHDRTAPTFTQPSSMQDLYLGNDPRLNPPPVGEVTAGHVSTNTRGVRRGVTQNRHLQAAANRRKSRMTNRGAGIVLEVQSHYRFLIHKTVEDYPALASFSIGEGDDRQTVVCLVSTLNRTPKGQELLMSSPQSREQPLKQKGRGRGRINADNTPSPSRVAEHTSTRQTTAEQESGDGGTGTNSVQASQSQPASRLAGKGRARARRPEMQRYVPRGRREMEQATEHQPSSALTSSSDHDVPDSWESLSGESTVKETEPVPGKKSRKLSANSSPVSESERVKAKKGTKSVKSDSPKKDKHSSITTSKHGRPEIQRYVPRPRRKMEEGDTPACVNSKMVDEKGDNTAVETDTESCDSSISHGHASPEQPSHTVPLDMTQISEQTDAMEWEASSRSGVDTDSSTTEAGSVACNTSSLSCTAVSNMQQPLVDSMEQSERCVTSKQAQKESQTSKTFSGWARWGKSEVVSDTVQMTPVIQQNIQASGPLSHGTGSQHTSEANGDVKENAQEDQHSSVDSDGGSKSANTLDTSRQLLDMHTTSTNHVPSADTDKVPVSANNTSSHDKTLSEDSKRLETLSKCEMHTLPACDSPDGLQVDEINTKASGSTEAEKCTKMETERIELSSFNTSSVVNSETILCKSQQASQSVSSITDKHSDLEGLAEDHTCEKPEDEATVSSGSLADSEMVDAKSQPGETDNKIVDVSSQYGDASSGVIQSSNSTEDVGQDVTYQTDTTEHSPELTQTDMSEPDEVVMYVEETSAKKDKLSKEQEPVSQEKGGEMISQEEEEEEDSWDKMFDDSGDCLDPSKIAELTAHVGEVKISKPKKINYLDYQPKESDMDLAAFSHIIEIADFPVEFQTRDLLTAFKDYMSRGFDIKWVDDTHALGVFSSTIAAQDALKMVHPMMKVRPLSQASKQSQNKARRCQEFLQPYKARPETTAAAARRLVAGALGMASRVSKEQREQERKQLKEAREKKKLDKKQKDAIWDGTFGKCAMDQDE